MSAGRFKDVNWDLAGADGKVPSWQHVEIAVLMDIRDELRSLNALLHCHNFVDVPRKLDAVKDELRRVRLNTTRRKKKPTARKPKLQVVA